MLGWSMSIQGVEGGTGGEFDVLFAEGTRFLQQHRYAEAIESFQRALALAPGSERASECLCGLGVAYSSSSGTRRAGATWSWPTSGDPLSPHPLIRLAGLSARKNAPARMKAFLAEGLRS